MKRSRAERRADPEKWWHVTGLSSGMRVLAVGESDRVFLKGDVQGVAVVQLSARLSRTAGQAVFDAVQRSLEGAGIERAVIVPDGVEFMRLEPVSETKAAELEHGFRRAEEAEARAQKDRMH